MKILPSTLRGQVIMAFSACFLFMALMIAINYGNFFRLSGSMQFFEIAEELNSSLLEMRRYEKNYFLYQKEHDFEENLTYTNRLSLILSREKDNLIRSMGRENYDRFIKYIGEYSALMEDLRTRFPAMELSLLPHLGADDAIVPLLLERMEGAASLAR